MKKLFLLLLLLCSLSYASELSLLEREGNKKATLILDVLTPKEYTEIKLNRYKNNYSISIGDQEHEIPNYRVSKPLREMNPEQLAGFLQSNYLSLKQSSDGTFALEEHGRLCGGGPGGGLAGWLGGYAAGEVVGHAVVVFSGHLILFGTQKAIGAYAGPAAEAEFEEKLNTRILPNLHVAAERVGHGAGIVRAITGGLFGSGAPTP